MEKNREPYEYEQKVQEYHTEIRRKNREDEIGRSRSAKQTSTDQYHLNKKYQELEGCPLGAEYIEFNKNQYTTEMLPHLANLMQQNEPQKILYGLVGVRKILASGIPGNIQIVLDLGLAKRILELASQTMFVYFQLEAAWCITNIASDESQYCQCLVDRGVIPVIVSLLESPYRIIVLHAIWAMANIAADNVVARNQCIKYEALQKLIKIVEAQQQSEDEELKRKAIWALVNLCRRKPLTPFNIVSSALRCLCKFIRESDGDDETYEAQIHACIAIQNYCQGSAQRLDFFLGQDIVDKLLNFICQKDELALPALKILGNIATGSFLQAQVIIEHGFMSYVELLLSSKNTDIRRETCWTLSNICSTNQIAADRFLQNQKILGLIMDLFECDTLKVKKQIMYIFSGICDQCEELELLKVIRERCVIRNIVAAFQSEDTGMVECALQTLEKFLQIGRRYLEGDHNLIGIELNAFYGIEALEELQNHPDKRIYAKAFTIIERYFKTE